MKAPTQREGGRRPADRTAVTAAAAADYRPPYAIAALAAIAVWALYAVTLAPTTKFWDASEYIATAHIMGIPHPPGNPTFVVLARAWDVLLDPLGFSVPVKINLFSASMTALAHGFWFLAVHRILSFYSPDRLFRLAGAGAAVALSAAAFTVWHQSNVNEKVYTVSLFTIALLTWLAFRWRDRGERDAGLGRPGADSRVPPTGDGNLLLLMVFLLALSVGNHLMAFLAAPAILVYMLMVEPRTFMNWRLYAVAVVVAAVGLSSHVFLPLRASLGPIINQADPSTWQALWESLTRQQYDKPSVLLDPVAYTFREEVPRGVSLMLAQAANYLQYFDWQWARSISGPDTWFGGMRPLFTLGIAALGIYGAWTHYHRDRISWAYFAILFLTLSAGLVFYLNFRYGYSYPAEHITRDMREVRERDYFFIASFSVWGLWAGIGLAALWQQVAERLRSLSGASRGLLAASPILLLALLPLLLNWSWASRSSDYSARDWAYNLLNSAEPYAVLFTNGDNDTFPLWYLQEVEGLRQDVTVIVMSYLNTPWYIRQLRDLTRPCPEGVDPADDRTLIVCQRPFRADRAPAIYADTESARQPPTRSIFDLTDEEIASVHASYRTSPGSFFLSRPLAMTVGRLEWEVPGGRALIPAEVFMLHIIQTALEDRPIYYAATTGTYEPLGLADHIIRQGVAYRLSNGPVETGPEVGVFEMPPRIAPAAGPYLDLDRTEILLREVFIHRGGIPDEWDKWVDAPTQSIPLYYAFAHYGVASAHTELDNGAEAEWHLDRADAWHALSQR